MNIFQLTEHIRSNEAAIEFLRKRGILRALDHPPLCPLCGQEMTEYTCCNVYISIICCIFRILIKVDIFG